MENETTIAEQYDALPQIVKDVLDKYATDENDYESCANLVKELNTIGWTCEYYLDAEPYNLRKLIKKGQSYTYSEIERFSNDIGMDEADYDVENLGNDIIGGNFLTLTHKTKDIIMSFVLSGVVGGSFSYECVYTDLDNNV
jgi:hypothetical protein